MSPKFFIIAASSLVLLGCSLLPSDKTTAPITNNATETEVSPASIQEAAPSADATESATPKTFTLDEIAQHNTATDCWFAIEDKVYDVTAYIAGGKHGGGPAIIEGCGKDATSLFETRPMGSGTPHSDKARSFLPNFEIGKLSQ